MVIRRLGSDLPNYKDLGLPPVLPKLIMSKLGLILFVGGTGSGKSTSMAALIDYRNQKSKGHIITIEDPVEFTHPHKGCIVNQREVGTPRAADLIAKGDVGSLKELMEKSAEQGMQTFDMALYKLYKDGKITMEEALKNADSKNNLRLRITPDENPAAKKKEEGESDNQ